MLAYILQVCHSSLLWRVFSPLMHLMNKQTPRKIASQERFELKLSCVIYPLVSWISVALYSTSFIFVNNKLKELVSIIFPLHELSCLTNLFSGVHDSFWTHACDVDGMNQILRKKFVELYNMPILENVSL